MTIRRALLGLLALLLLAIGGCAAVVGATTSYSKQQLAFVGRGKNEVIPPSWTAPCRRYDRRYRRAYVLPCARVQGVVLYRQGRDPDGDGDVHDLAAAGHHLVIVKSNSHHAASKPLPGVGRRVDVSGTVTRGRFGLPVVDIRHHRGR